MFNLNEKKFKSVAIDGPAGAGKSDVSSILAKKLGFIHVDTGALYRAVAFYFLNYGSCNENYIENHIDNVKIDMKFENNVQKIFINSADVTNKLRTIEVSNAVSDISAMNCVRKFLLSSQRDISKINNVIMDGRDIGTVVLPNANVKIFLTASAEERAKRRLKQLESKNVKCNYEEILNSIKLRDETDAKRVNSPLKIAKDSIIYDTTDKKIDEVISYLFKYINDHI